jgi:hypothetical protein
MTTAHVFADRELNSAEAAAGMGLVVVGTIAACLFSIGAALWFPAISEALAALG